MIELNKIYNESCIDTMARMPDESVNCCITSPPYWSLRDYNHPDQFGLEATPELYTEKLADIFDEVRRVLTKDGTLWLNLGDSYISAKSDYMPPQTIAGKDKRDYLTKDSGIGYPPNRPTIRGYKQKDLTGIPWMVAFELRKRGWWLRQDIIWHKPNPMPESVTDRCTKAHEYIFLMSKSSKYYYDAEAIRTPLKDESIARLAQDVANQTGSSRVPNKTNGAMKAVRKEFKSNEAGSGSGLKGHSGYYNENGELNVRDTANKKSVWTVTTKPFKEAHFATFPEALVVPMIQAGCKEGGIVFDPFSGAATTALVAHKLGRKWIGSELNADYCEIAKKRLEPYLAQDSLF